MRNAIPRFAGPVLVAAAVGGIIWVSAGDLDPPPGPVAPTMKTPTEVELESSPQPTRAVASARVVAPRSRCMSMMC